MISYIIKRILGIFPTLFIIATACFFLIRLAPGGPFDSERKIPEEILRNIEAKYHLNEPLYVQYGYYLRDLVQGDLGPSFRYASYSVNEIIAEGMAVTFPLAIVALIYSLLLGIITGLIAASRPNTFRDYSAMTFSLLGVCLPSFVIGPLFILAFSIHLEWFNVAGLEEWKDYVLPAICLGTLYSAFISRLTRSGMLDVLRQDFIRTAKAKGLPAWKVIVKHGLKGALIPVVGFTGPAIAGILTGSFVIETIFDINGVGRHFVQSALNRDYTLLMGMVLLFALILLVMNIIVDIMYAILDPRISYK